jgi:hypothetical protein
VTKRVEVMTPLSINDHRFLQGAVETVPTEYPGIFFAMAHTRVGNILEK